jgi:hypothetical protein
VVRRAIGRIRIIDLESVLVHVPVVGMVQMPIMQIIHMVVVFDRGVPTIFSVYVVVVWMLVTLFSHDYLL